MVGASLKTKATKYSRSIGIALGLISLIYGFDFHTCNALLV